MLLCYYSYTVFPTCYLVIVLNTKFRVPLETEQIEYPETIWNLDS